MDNAMPTAALTPRMLPVTSIDGEMAETPRSGSPIESVDHDSSIGGQDSTPASVNGNGGTDIPAIPSRPSSPPAQNGLGSLSAEQHLVEALRSKDRLFVLGLGQDIESFIQRLLLAPPESLIDVKPLGVSAQSKFQRMLVYKAAEWYGLKAVAGGDGNVLVGLAMIGLNEASAMLRLSSLVPREPSPPQTFRIMRRTAPSSASSNPSVAPSTANGNTTLSRSTSVSGDNEGSERGRKTMTIEEREREYARVRMRIFNKGEEDDMSSTSGSVKGREKEDEPTERGRQHRAEMRGESDDEDPVPRHAYTAKGWEEPIFASVYYQSAPPPPDSVASGSSVSVPPARPPQIAPSGPYGPQYPPTYYGPTGPQYGLQKPTQFPHQLPRMQAPHPYPPGGRQQAWEAGAPMYPQQFYPEQGDNWGPQYYPPYQEQYGYPPPMPPYGYTHSQYTDSPSSGNVSSPIPTRPSNFHHYSTTSSSSISSRSIDGSRPHSRGSTTSSRSGGARMGAIYPAGAPGPGQRQRAMSRGMGNELRRWSVGTHDGVSPETTGARSQRGQSPASTTSSSSRSRRSQPLPTPLPGQHPLPNRPDWSANNVPYQPSVRPPPIPPTTADFPPLRGAGTDAIPMQAERAKIRTTPGVWDGSNARKALHHPQHPQQNQHQQQQQVTQPRILANPMYQYQPQPAPIPAPPRPPRPPAPDDPDFPRRPVRSAGTLYDPSAASGTASASAQTHPIPGEREGMTNEEIMEAKLAALSVSTGVIIGPAPSKQKQVQSYARIVRRE